MSGGEWDNLYRQMNEASQRLSQKGEPSYRSRDKPDFERWIKGFVDELHEKFIIHLNEHTTEKTGADKSVEFKCLEKE
jgi:hypothetical protein